MDMTHVTPGWARSRFNKSDLLELAECAGTLGDALSGEFAIPDELCKSLDRLALTFYDALNEIEAEKLAQWNNALPIPAKSIRTRVHD